MTSHDGDETFGQVLWRLVANKHGKMSNEAFAARIGVTGGMIGKWRSDTDMPTQKHFDAIIADLCPLAADEATLRDAWDLGQLDVFLRRRQWSPDHAESIRACAADVRAAKTSRRPNRAAVEALQCAVVEWRRGLEPLLTRGQPRLVFREAEFIARLIRGDISAAEELEAMLGAEARGQFRSLRDNAVAYHRGSPGTHQLAAIADPEVLRLLYWVHSTAVLATFDFAPADMIRRLTTPHLGVMRYIAHDRLDSAELVRGCFIADAHVAYIAEDMPTAIRAGQAFLATDPPGSADISMSRLVLVASSTLPPSWLTSDLQERVVKMLKSGQIEDADLRIYAYEGLARALARQHRPSEAYEYIISARKIIADSGATPGRGLKPMRSVALTRAALEVAVHTGDRSRDVVDPYIQSALSIARDHGYWRHGGRIEALLAVLESRTRTRTRVPTSTSTDAQAGIPPGARRP